MKTRARSTKQNDTPHGDENRNETISNGNRKIGVHNKSSRRNGISNLRLDPNSPSSRENSVSPPSGPGMERNGYSAATVEQNERMVLITTALSGWTGRIEGLFEIKTWKQLIKNSVAGDHLMERRYRADDRLMKFAEVIIEQITSTTFRQNVHGILASSRIKKNKMQRANQFLSLCDDYEAKKSAKAWKNAIGEETDSDARDTSGWQTDEGEKYDGPLLTVDEYAKLNSSCETGDDENDMDVEKENVIKKSRLSKRRLNHPLGTARSYANRQSRCATNVTTNRRVNPDLGEADIDSPSRYHLTRQCKVALNPLVMDDRQLDINLARAPILERLTLNEQRETDKSGPNFNLVGTEDEFIENETPPSTPLNGSATDLPSDHSAPKRNKFNTKEPRDLLLNGMDLIREEPVLKSTPIRGGCQAVGSTDMIDRTCNGFDYFSVIEDSVAPNGKGDDDDIDLPDLSPPEQKDNKENSPKSEQDIASYYPKPPLAPELKPHMFDEMQEALSKPKKEKIVSAFELTIRQEHLAIYNKPEWLEDVNIDFYLELIKDRNNRPESGYPKVYIFHSFFYKLLEKKGYEAVRGATGAEDIFEYELVLIPIHSSHHWVLVAVNFVDKSMTCYDSMDHDNTNQLKIIAKFLTQEYKENERLKGNSTSETDNGSGDDIHSNWSLGDDLSFQLGGQSHWKFADKGEGVVPQQTNGRDCGVFCLQFAEYLSRRQDFDFEQKHTAYFRKRMLYETLKKTLLIQ